jgi:hypothetical protein
MKSPAFGGVRLKIPPFDRLREAGVRGMKHPLYLFFVYP